MNEHRLVSEKSKETKTHTLHATICVIDSLDTDSDNDGIDDSVEGGSDSDCVCLCFAG